MTDHDIYNGMTEKLNKDNGSNKSKSTGLVKM